MKQSGLTFIELLVVVVIVGILSAIAVPSYEAYVRRSVEATGRSCVLEGLTRAERFFTRDNRYPTTAGALYGTVQAVRPCDERSDYQLRVAAASAACPAQRCIELVAQPVSPAAERVGSVHLRYDLRQPAATRRSAWILKDGTTKEW